MWVNYNVVNLDELFAGEQMDEYFAINAVLSLFAKNYMDLKKDLPIRPSEMGVLNIIAQSDGVHTPVAIASLLGVSKPMMSAHVTSLESKGYITKQPCVNDGRAYYILPTDKALQLVESARKDMKLQLEKLIDGMGKDNFENFVKLATTANDILQNKGE